MLKQTKKEFFQDRNAVSSVIALLGESYLDPEKVLKNAFIKSDTIYYQQENSIVQTIGLSKVFANDNYPKDRFIYLGMTAGKKESKKGEAFNCVAERLKDVLKKIDNDNNLYAVSSLSTPFTYNYYKRFTTDLQPDSNGVIQDDYKFIYQTIFESTFGKQNRQENVWLLKNYTQTRYIEIELNRIDGYLEKNNIHLFNKDIFDLKSGDRVIVLGKVDKNL